MRTKSLTAIFVTLLIVYSGCSDKWMEEETPHLITTESLFNDLNGFEAGLNALYALVRVQYEEGWGGYSMLKAFFIGGTDNVTPNHYTGQGYSNLTADWGAINNPHLEDYAAGWAWLYSIVNAANTLINRAESTDNIDWTGNNSNPFDNKNRVIAEAKLFRAWAYRHLSYGWGDVPLSLIESGEIIRTDWERTPVRNVRHQIISDLIFAEKHIPVRPALRGKVTKGVAQHYLSEMYLVDNKPDSALFWATKAINTPEYKVITERYGIKKDKPGVPFMDMFQEGNENYDQGNTEALWVIQFAKETVGGSGSRFIRWCGSRFDAWVINGVRPWTMTYERGGRGQSRQSLTKWALEIYEPQDDRASIHAIRWFFILNDAKANAPYAADRLPPGYNYGDTIWLDSSVDITRTNYSRNNWPFSRKPEGCDPENPASGYQYNDHIYLRLADTYLLKAEAEYKLRKFEDAAETINILRRRSNASLISSSDVNIDFILDERSRELVLEEDRRWHLLRTGKWLERLQKYNKNGGQNAAARDTIWPIPQIVIDANLTREMAQNPGF
jgi:starch-binding outer membrane protein, SusD/RagB family